MFSDSRKVIIIGAGYVGSSIAYALMMKEVAKEIILIDQDEKKAQAEMLDIHHGISYMGSAIIKSGSFSDIVDASLIIITAGRNRKVGETRLEMASDNVSIMNNVLKKLKRHYTTGVILVVSNPIDIMTFVVDQYMDLPSGRVFGTGSLLDSSRFITTIADFIGIDHNVVNAQVVGEHGDLQIPLWSKVTIAGIPLVKYCQSANIIFGEKQMLDIEQKVINMGNYIIAGKGRTHYGIATCTCLLADAILNKHATIATVCSRIEGEYGLFDVSLSLPSIIHTTGIERRLEDYLSDEENERLRISATRLKEKLNQLLG